MCCHALKRARYVELCFFRVCVLNRTSVHLHVIVYVIDQLRTVFFILANNFNLAILTSSLGKPLSTERNRPTWTPVAIAVTDHHRPIRDLLSVQTVGIKCGPWSASLVRRLYRLSISKRLPYTRHSSNSWAGGGGLARQRLDAGRVIIYSAGGLMI